MKLAARISPLFQGGGDHRSDDLIFRIRRSANRLQDLDDHRLVLLADGLRDVLSRRDDAEDDILVDSFALSAEALRRTLGIHLHGVQLQAALALAAGRIVEMQTGEGKTFAAVPAAVLRGLTGRGVHVVTPNQYLARRDCEQLRPVYEALGLSVAVLPEQCALGEKFAAYRSEITYGTASEFGFDYLRDQIELRKSGCDRPGELLLKRLRGQFRSGSSVMQRSRAFAIIDEADNVLLDEAGSPLILCASPTADAEDAAVHRMVRGLLADLQPDRDFRFLPTVGVLELTAQGTDRIYSHDLVIPAKQLRRPWSEYVEQALQAEFLFHRDMHYIVRDNSVQIVDAGTGRIFADRTWRDGLHQAIEAKENLRITAEKHVLARITRQRFFRMYDRLAGMTGTAAGCEREFHTVYGATVRVIPPRIPARRQVRRMRCFCSADARRAAIVSDVETIHRSGRPILLATRSIAESECLADDLRQRGLSLQLLNGRQDADEAQIISAAGQTGAITVSTNMAGRGTDIRLGDGVHALGGLHVIVSEPHDSFRGDRQLIGRCGRQGDPGTAQVYLSCDDAVVRLFGAWLRKPMLRSADRTGEVHADLSGCLRRVQQGAERARYAARAALLRHDLARDQLLTRGARDP